ncbi:kinase-like protein [Basidiobolus meristosporus CBS 931.73]|uniref:Kinase-like protein n=1 Tax=Basidiobolus meristosporus CBS 931.73 TaxID=1314790 RepID=A0A1Y1Y069_9FUNG|nr:kinase-like protein [Basidiobolus meristosporus CBS 931.73]|eukprot:ORX91397.1 kinase-like protein [Basidiobolus meristosporus CBS 931.73]
MEQLPNEVSTLIFTLHRIEQKLGRVELIKRQTQRVCERLSVLLNALICLKQHEVVDPTIQESLCLLRQSVERTEDIIEKFTPNLNQPKSENWYHEAVRHGVQNLEFLRIHKLTSSATHLLSIALNLEHDFDESLIFSASTEDYNELVQRWDEIKSKFLEGIAELPLQDPIQVKLKRSLDYQLGKLSKIIKIKESEDIAEVFASSIEIPFFELSFLEHIGSSPSGSVYRGIYRGEDVAIKQLNFESFASHEWLKQLRQRVHALCELRSQHINGLIGACLEPGRYCIVMPYMAKRDLAQHLRSSQFSWGRRIQYALDIARGLRYLKCVPMAHGNLRCSNIMLDTNEGVHLSDFAFWDLNSTVQPNYASRYRIPPHILPWCAPELYTPGSRLDIKCDIYSFGFVMWELAAQSVPFHDLSESEIRQKVQNGERPPLFVEPPFLNFTHLMHACWKQDRRERIDIDMLIQSLEEMYELDQRLEVVENPCYNPNEQIEPELSSPHEYDSSPFHPLQATAPVSHSSSEGDHSVGNPLIFNSETPNLPDITTERNSQPMSCEAQHAFSYDSHTPYRPVEIITNEVALTTSESPSTPRSNTPGQVPHLNDGLDESESSFIPDDSTNFVGHPHSIPNLSNTPTRMRGPYVKKKVQMPKNRLEPGSHLPIHIEKRKRCYLCRHNCQREGKSSSKAYQSNTKCQACDVVLCHTPKRNCFVQYHTSNPTD